MKCNEVENVFKADACVELEADVPADPCDQPGIAQASLVDLIDMLWCVVRYGIGYLDYKVFGFAFIHGEARKTFMTMDDNLALVRAVNDKAYTYLFDQKCAFNERFHRFLGREWLDLRTADVAAFADFIKDREDFFAKEVDSFGGQGVSRVFVEEYPDSSALYHQLRGRGQYLVEETIRQHPEMERLHPGSINTLRVVTLLTNGEPYVMYALIRVGGKGQCIDNICSGGMYAPVDENGMVFHDAFCELEERFYACHAESGVPFVGFQVPCFHEAVMLVKGRLWLCRRSDILVGMWQLGWMGLCS